MSGLLTGLVLSAALLKPDQASALGDFDVLLGTIRATGTRIALDESPKCRSSSRMGVYTFERGVEDTLTICIANHRGNRAELLDTILHEAVHVAQTCKRGLLSSPQDILRSAPARLVSLISATYSASQLYSELEAATIALSGDVAYVTDLVRTHCFE